MIKNGLILVVRGYQRCISPLFQPSCRYYPSCSNYTIQALRVHGTIKGLLMGAARILRCNPFARGGIDYVPTQFSLRKNFVDEDPPNYEESKL